MSNNTQFDQSSKPSKIREKTVIKHHPNGETELISTEKLGIDPNTGNPTKTIENYQESDGLCANPWGFHPPMRIHIGYTGFETEEGTLLCTQCFEHNKKLIDRKAMWRIPLIYDPKTF